MTVWAPKQGAPPETAAVVGSLLGLALGDALALPYEGMRPRRTARYAAQPLAFRLVPGRGIFSDDTEHAAMVLRALARAGGTKELLPKTLAIELRWWLAALPAATGLATLRAGLKLLLGASPERSGVPSAGNGPCMRATVLGALAGGDMLRLIPWVDASTRITHTDPRATAGALAVAGAAGLFAELADWPTPEALLERMSSTMNQWSEHRPQREAVKAILEPLEQVIRDGRPPDPGRKGVSGFVVPTVASVAGLLLQYPRDYTKVVQGAIALGGDTDTVAAIAGGIMGAAGVGVLPPDLVAGLKDWPVTAEHLVQMAEDAALAVARNRPVVARRPPYPWSLARNAVFAGVVLTHGLLRLVPR